ncbi:CLN3 protein [Ditylenchus destructor]|nr:CLN3 protein [Ditylenchus destructor]
MDGLAEDDEDQREFRPILRNRLLGRNVVAFWILGLCNNFAYVVMLSAAKDILEKEHIHQGESCIEKVADIKCSKISTGAVLLADILPALVIKMVAPFTLHYFPYSVRHGFVIFCQISSFLIVALSESLTVGLIGVVFASIGAGLGELSYLSLSSHFHSDTISYWSSGTGGAGIAGSLAFAVLTDRRLLDLSPKSALLAMLVVPFVLLLTYWLVLESPPSVRKIKFFRIQSYLIRGEDRRSYDDVSNENESPHSPLLLSTPNANNQFRTRSPITIRESITNRIRLIRALLRYMVPLATVYFAEYFINQGLLELLVFPCDTGFNLSQASQYRWYQVLYQIGVFISRSSINICPIRPTMLPILAILQLVNAIVLFNDALHPHVPHIIIIFAIVFYEGLLGGSAYVNTFNTVHKSISGENREFSIMFVTLSDSSGIVLAGFFGIIAHNFICAHR